LLIYVGAFAEDNSFPSMVIMLLFGVLGWLMVRLDWPRPPLLLGVVLGPLLENNLFLAIESQGARWLLRPGVLLLFVIGLTVLFIPLLRRMKNKRARQFAKSPESTHGPRPIRGAALVFDVFLLALIGWALWLSRDWPQRTRLLPWVAEWPTLALVVAQLGIDVRKFYAQDSHRQVGSIESAGRLESLGIWCCVVGTFLAIWVFGFFLAVPLTLFLYLKYIGHETTLLSIGLAASAWAIFQTVFGCVATIPFPDGALLAGLERAMGLTITESLPNVCSAIPKFW